MTELNIPTLFEEMNALLPELKRQLDHPTTGEHFGWSYAHRIGPDGFQTDDADIRCGCGLVLHSFIKDKPGGVT